MGIFSGGSGSGGSSTTGREIGYDAITAPVTVNSTTEASGTTIIACAAHTFPGTPVLATFYAPFISTDATTNHQLVLCLFEGATEIGRLANLTTVANFSQVATTVALLRFTPSAASHTYTVTGWMTAGTGAVMADVSGTAKNVAAFIRFTQV